MARSVALAIVVALLPACAGSTGPRADGNRREFTKAANARARAIADRIAAGGVVCDNYADSVLGPLRATYAKQRIPIPLGSGQCEGGPARENVLIEVFPATPPNGAAFIARKAALLCRKGFELGRNPDGTNDFPGLPYIIAGDHRWVVEPDSNAFNAQIARTLGRPARNACTRSGAPTR